jgi:BirA family biotin operon repressor/biotin-[acetyl-CoA-carboxylase] ligase
MAPADSVTLTAWTAVAAMRAISKVSGFTPGIKWVNDLVSGGRKLCGILTEMSVESETGMIDNIIIGIGININNDASDFPDEIKDIAGAVADVYTAEERNRLAAEILCSFENNFGSSELPDKYRSLSTVIGKDIKVITPSETYYAKALEIDDHFGLTVMTEDEKKKTLRSGEISIRTK